MLAESNHFQVLSEKINTGMTCPVCYTKSFVHRQKKGKMYAVCQTCERREKELNKLVHNGIGYYNLKLFGKIPPKQINSMILQKQVEIVRNYCAKNDLTHNPLIIRYLFPKISHFNMMRIFREL